MKDLCNSWDAVNKITTLRHNKIKASFHKSLHVVGYIFNVIIHFKSMIKIIWCQQSKLYLHIKMYS